MRYALIFAGVAAAYDAYGYDGYGDTKVSSSTPAVSKSSSTPAYGGYGDDYKTSSATSSKPTPIGYTTIHPGYGKEPITVTSQYQPYPTCGAAGSDGKSCDKWNEDKYVSTVINDCDSKKVTVTYVDKPITVYHTKTTITHYATASFAGGKDGKAYPTGSYGYDDKKNGTKTWYEMYEKVHEVEYKNLGAHGLPGYGGSGLCKTCDDEQPYKVKEYKDGKWSEYETRAIYKAPVPETKTYEKPGVYTEPAKDVTVSYTITKPSEATTTAKAGIPVTYGGVTTEFKETGVKTCAYGAYETGKDKDGNDVTSNVVKTVTVTVSTTGKYEVAKPTTTVYDKETEVKYPTVSIYQPGVYHKDAQTVTITKSGDSASCEYKQTKTYPAGPRVTPNYDDEYSHGGSSKPSVESKTSSVEYPSYPTSSSPSYDDKSSSIEYPSYPASSSVPSYDDEKSSSTEYPSYPATTTVPHYEVGTSTPCTSSTKPVDDGKKSSSTAYPEYPVASSSAPSYDDEKSSSIEYPSYPATTTVPHYEVGTSTPCPSSTKPVDDGKSSSIAYPEYPVASSSAPASYPVPAPSTPVYEAYPTATPAKYTDNESSYGAIPSKTTAAYPGPSEYHEEKTENHDAGKSYGYSKRAGVAQRRKAAVAKRSNNAIVA